MPKVAALLEDEWRRELARSGLGDPRGAVSAGDDACPACGEGGPLVDGACPGCGLQLG